MFDYTVRDSSLWQSAQQKSMNTRKDSFIRAGMVRQRFYDKKEDELEIKYLVDVIDPRGQFPLICRKMYDFGGVFDYEEYTHQTYQEKTDGTGKGNFKTRPGDVVLVAYVGGDEKEGVIIGALKHPARKEALQESDKTAYYKEFNGVETTINNDGEWKLRYRGVPTNRDTLSNPPSENTVISPEYDEEIGNGYFTVYKDGSWEIADAAKEKPQSIKIDKPNGTVTVISGNVTLTIDKNKETYSLTCKEASFDSSDKFSIKTKKYNLESNDVEIKASKIKQQGELNHTGATKIKGATEITGNCDVKGNFSSSGQTKLANGTLPLINQILLIMGTGNKGLPVISKATVIQTSMTTAA